MDKTNTGKDASAILELRLRGGVAGVNVPLFALYADGRVDYSESKALVDSCAVRKTAQLSPEQSTSFLKSLGIGEWFYTLQSMANFSLHSDAFAYEVIVRNADRVKTVRIDADWESRWRRWKAPWRFVRLVDKLRLYKPPR